MTLWNIIRDFFVQYIFGGYTSNGDIYSSIVGVVYNNNADMDTADTNLGVPIGNFFNDNEFTGTVNYLTFGDWLSTTFTIITLIAICFFLFLVVRWLFRLTAGLISGRG